MYNLSHKSKVPQPSSNKVYASFFPTNTTEAEVRSMFEKFGPISLLQFHQRKDGFTYAHITYESVEAALEAIIVMHKKKLQDKFLNVSFASENCVPKWKRIQEKQEKSQELEPLQLNKNIIDIGRKASKKTIKKEKQRERARLRKLLSTAPNPLEYFDKIEQALRDVLKLKELLLTLKKEQIIQNKKEVEPVEPKRPEKEPESKISLAELSVFKSWLKTRVADTEKEVKQGTETEWDEANDQIEPGQQAL